MNLAKQFRQKITRSFNLDELRELVFDLSVDWDELDGRTKSNKIQALITHCQRRQLLPQLIDRLREERPKVAWPDAAELAKVLTIATPVDPQQRNRQNILNNIHHTWIEGVLEPALHNDVALSLSLRHQHGALNRPSRSLLPEEEPISPEVTLAELFTARGRAMLILGQPASGKTIALLQLLQELLTVARADTAEPIPIFLNLSSWVWERLTLADWIVEELLVQYQTPRQLSRDWLAGNHLTLLLDGLDEVSTDQREACVDAINVFKAAHAADMVVCSRMADYGQLQRRLNLSTAVCLQPLTPTQVDEYLASFGEPLADLRQAITADDDWRELAQSPLLLNLMAYTYSGQTNLLPSDSPLVDKRRQLFATYIQRTKQNRPLPPESPYNEADALHWLQNIASRLQAHDQSVFYLEQLQPSWLPQSRSFRWLFGLTFGLFSGFIFGLAVLLIFGLIGGLTFNLASGLLWGLILGTVVWLIFGIVIGLLFGLKGGLGIRENFSEYFRDSSSVTLVEEVRWQRPSLVQLWVYLKGGLAAGFLIALVVGLSTSLSLAIIFGLIVLLIFGLFGSLDAIIQTGEPRLRTQPNQGIWVSWHNARRTGLAYGVISGLVFGLLGGMLGLLIGDLLSWLIIGLFFGLTVGLVVGPGYYGGESVIKHYVLRWMLARQGVLPFPFQDQQLIAYLDEMAARLLLRRVGGGWIFIHRTLLEFFADEEAFEKFVGSPNH